MRPLFSTLYVVAIAALALIVFDTTGTAHMVNGANIHVASGVGVVPSSDTVDLAPAQLSQYGVTADAALSAAVDAWKLAPGQVNQTIGLVPAIVSMRHSRLHQHELAWLAVANFPTVTPGSRVAYSRLVIVIDGHTGQWLYAYPVDPVGVQEPRTVETRGPVPSVHPRDSIHS